MTMIEMLREFHQEQVKEGKRMKTYKIVMCSLGGTRRDMYTGLSEKEAVEICEGYGWVADPDGGYVWDLEIEEED